MILFAFKGLPELSPLSIAGRVFLGGVAALSLTVGAVCDDTESNTKGFAEILRDHGGQPRSVLQANFFPVKPTVENGKDWIQTSVFGKAEALETDQKELSIQFELVQAAGRKWGLWVHGAENSDEKSRSKVNLADGRWEWKGAIAVWPAQEGGVASLDDSPKLRLRLVRLTDDDQEIEESSTTIFLGDVWYVAGGSEVGMVDEENGGSVEGLEEVGKEDSNGGGPGASTSDSRQTVSAFPPFRWVAYQKVIEKKDSGTNGDREIGVSWAKFSSYRSTTTPETPPTPPAENPPATPPVSPPVEPPLTEARQEISDSALAKAFSEEWQKQTGRPVLMIVLPGYRSLIGDWTADSAPAHNPASVPETAPASDANSPTPIPDIPSALTSIPFTNELEAASRFIGSRGLIWWHGAWEADYGIPQEDKGIVTLRSNYSKNLPKLFQKWRDYKPGTQQFLIVQCPLSVRASGVSQIFLDSWKTADEKIDPLDTLQAIRFAQADYVKESWAKTAEAETAEAETTEAETTEAETTEAAAAKTEPVPKISLVLPIREVRVPERGSELLPVENLSISEAGRLLASVAHARDTETVNFEMGKIGDFDLEHKDKSSKEVLDFPTAKGWSWNRRTLEAYLPGEGQSESVLPRFKKVFQDPAEPVKKKEDFYLLAPEFDSKSP